MNPDQSTTGRNPPASDNDPIAGLAWMGLKDEHLCTPTEQVLLRRLEFLAQQNRVIMQTQERILAALEGDRRRRSSMSSTGTGVTETTEGEEIAVTSGPLGDHEIMELLKSNDHKSKGKKRASTASPTSLGRSEVDGLPFSSLSVRTRPFYRPSNLSRSGDVNDDSGAAGNDRGSRSAGASTSKA